MPRPGTIIPKAAIIKLMQNAGAERVSDDAAKALVDYLTEYAMKLSEGQSRLQTTL
jgi:histone H3/H4